MSEELVRRRVLVEGQVQAVGFRASCARRAERAEIGGWVRNLADGRVEAAFEGPTPLVESLVSWCQDGPPMARVTRVLVFEEEPVGEVNFSVR